MKKSRGLFNLIMAALLSGFGVSVRADTIILDYSPSANSASMGSALNGEGWQYFEPVTFPVGGTLTGVAIYTDTRYAAVPTADVQIFANSSANTPGTQLLAAINQSYTEDAVGARPGENDARALVTLPQPFTIDPGQTYWIGMEGHNGDLSSWLYQGVSDDPYTLDLYQVPGVGNPGNEPADVAMQLIGTLTPEPASLSVLALGIPLFVRRRRTY